VTAFQPTMLGTEVRFEDGETGMITDERETELLIESDFFTGWMTKAEFWEALSGDY
jgi:hypothetical protein